MKTRWLILIAIIANLIALSDIFLESASAQLTFPATNSSLLAPVTNLHPGMGLGQSAPARFAPRGGNLVLNGSFETPVLPVSTTAGYSAPSSFGNWTVELGSIDLIGNHFWQHYDGNQSVDMNGASQGIIYQDIPTVPGQAYLLSFAMAGNPDGGIQTVSLEVWWGSTLVASPTFSSTHTKLNMAWEFHQYTVIATSTISRVRFKSTTANCCYGAALDAVSVGSGAPNLVLELPFPHTSTDTGLNQIDNFFDHAYPITNSEPLTATGAIRKFNGETATGTRSNCLVWFSCYSGHDGYDFHFPYGSPVLAAHSGTAVATQAFCPGGNPINLVTITQTQSRYRTAYLYLQPDAYWQNLFNSPQSVVVGDRIGTTGNSGAPGCSPYVSHLHFGVYYDVTNNGDFVPVDPYGWQAPQPDPWSSYSGGAPSTWLWSFSPPDLEAAPPGITNTLTISNANAIIPPGSLAYLAQMNLSIAPEPWSATTGIFRPRPIQSRSLTSTISTGYTFQLTGVYTDSAAVTSFSNPVTVTITYTDSKIVYVNPASLAIYQWNQGATDWVALTTTINSLAHQATTTLTAPSLFSLRGQPLSSAPTLATISPISGNSNIPRVVSITGENFVATPQVDLGLSILSVDSTSASTLTATIPSFIATGTYTLTLRNPDGQFAILPNAFTVVQSTYLPLVTR